MLSDLRFEDAVAVRSALGTLPLEVEFERFGDELTNAGISRLEVPDLARAEGSVTAEVEIHGGRAGDSLSIQVYEEDRPVAQSRVAAPSAGLRTRVPIDPSHARCIRKGALYRARPAGRRCLLLR